MDERKRRSLSYLSAAVLAGVILPVFFKVQDYGPESAIRRFNQTIADADTKALLSGNSGELQRVTIEAQKVTTDSIKGRSDLLMILKLGRYVFPRRKNGRSQKWCEAIPRFAPRLCTGFQMELTWLSFGLLIEGVSGGSWMRTRRPRSWRTGWDEVIPTSVEVKYEIDEAVRPHQHCRACMSCLRAWNYGPFVV